MKCECGYALVTRQSSGIHLQFGEIVFYPDTGKVVAWCRRCPKQHVLDPGTSGARESTGAKEAREALAFMGMRN